ncbi:MAG TPA: hypothetical protein VF734_12710 [Pseudonocardiaceae bacterium]
MTQAVTEDLIAKNMANSMKLPSVRKRKGKAWSSEEARQFLESARSECDPLYAVYVLILVLGLRKGEVLGLTWDDIDLDAGELSIGRQLRRVSRQLLRRGAAATEGERSSLEGCGGASVARRQADLHNQVGHADRAAQLQPFMGCPLREGWGSEDHGARWAPHLCDAVGGLGRAPRESCKSFGTRKSE